MPVDPKLKPLYRETTFWVLLALSIPGGIAAYDAAWTGIATGSFDVESFYASVFALPIVIYLGVTRQLVRKESVRQIGENLHVVNNGYADAYADGFDAAAGFEHEDARHLTVDDFDPILPRADEITTSAAPPEDPPGTHPADAAHEQAEHYVTVTNPTTGESFTVPGTVAAAMQEEQA